MIDQLRETIRETKAMRDICARDITDRVIADDTTNEIFAVACRLYQGTGCRRAQ